jgi:cobalt-zinc-cadmium efflux system protein
LLIAVGSIGWEAIQRFFQVTETSGNVISYVAAFGIGINALSALLFFRDKEKDLNVKAAYLHLAIDALVSLGVVIGGILISYTGYSWIDPLISLMIIIVIALSTWRILSESLRLSLDAVPSHIDIEKIIQTVNSNPQVKAIHHIHIWAMSTTKNAMTAHLVLENNLSDHEISAIKHALKSKLAELNIQHITFETESENCSEEFC